MAQPYEILRDEPEPTHGRVFVAVCTLLLCALCALSGRAGLLPGAREVPYADTKCDELWRAMESRHTTQLEARGRAVLMQCPMSPQRTPPTRCSIPLARKPRRAGEDLTLRGMHVRAAWSLYEPEWICESEERVGAFFEPSADMPSTAVRVERFAAFGDGPKFVCGLDVLANRSCLVYSIGSHNEYGFEKAIKAVHPHCDIHTFDPTLGHNPGDGGSVFLGSAFSRFHDLGLGDPPGAGAEGAAPWRRKLRPLRALMQGLGHEGRVIDILKVDCEGCEWTAVADIFDEIARGRISIGQLQLEIHLAPSTSQEDIHGFMAKADRAGLRIFHKEPNVLHSDGFSAIEYAFVHRDFARTAFVHSHCRQPPAAAGPARDQPRQ